MQLVGYDRIHKEVAARRTGATTPSGNRRPFAKIYTRRRTENGSKAPGNRKNINGRGCPNATTTGGRILEIKKMKKNGIHKKDIYMGMS
jgi:hypothetical protein